MKHIGVIGAGAWGTALAIACHRAGRNVTLWARRAEIADAINTDHRNPRYLPDITLPNEIVATSNLSFVSQIDLLLSVVPAQHFRSVAIALAPTLPPDCPVVLCAKGIERDSLCLMSDVAQACLPGHPTAVLSGPTFAVEVARGLPTAVTLATVDRDLGPRLLTTLGSRTFRPYLSGDPLGAQIGGAVKNVLAIACGIIAGKDLGENARASLITRGLAELARLGTAIGAEPETFRGLSGLGDLTLTCSSLQSRNMSLGVALGRGDTLSDILQRRHSVAEGVHSARAVVSLAKQWQVDMPICSMVDAVLNNGLTIETGIETLLSRPFRKEDF